ncbi:MAG: hypothetical protein LBB75_00345 [Oscillospiraceae bacterium]|jgi:hypothetical protein|nr:hypothetical protein [Oscillospiraceae bacterium]
MKRFFALVLTGLLLFALAACSGAPADQAPFSDAPEAYRPLMEGILKLVQTAREEDGDWAWIREPGMEDLESQWLGGVDYTVKGNLGYAVADINSDGTPELLWLGKNRENPEELLLYALFTLQDGAPVRLFSRVLRFTGALAQDGTLHCTGSTGMETVLTTHKLEPGADELTQLTEDTLDAGAVNNPPNPMEYRFIPIEK